MFQNNIDINYQDIYLNMISIVETIFCSNLNIQIDYNFLFCLTNLLVNTFLFIGENKFYLNVYY